MKHNDGTRIVFFFLGGVGGGLWLINKNVDENISGWAILAPSRQIRMEIRLDVRVERENSFDEW